MVLGQVRCQEKSNEITAIPELLGLLELAGCIVTIDAMGCQKEIVKQIVKQKADYCISLKGNQGNLHKDIKDYFVWAEKIKFHELEFDYCETLRERSWTPRNEALLDNRRYSLVRTKSRLVRFEKYRDGRESQRSYR